MKERKRKVKQLYNSKRYIWPNPLASEEQRGKFLGMDIDNMSSIQCWQEIKRLESAAAWLEGDEVLFYTPTRTTTRLAWVVERIKKLKRGKGVEPR